MALQAVCGSQTNAQGCTRIGAPLARARQAHDNMTAIHMLNGARMSDRSRVLVTGGAGFIGRRVVRALMAEGHEVTVADLRAFPDPDVRSVTGDLCDPGVPERAVRPGTDVIIHLAAVPSVLASVNDPVSTHRLNVAATARLLELAREHDAATFLLASTNAGT